MSGYGMKVMAEWTPKPWLQPLPEWAPDSLPGFADAAARVERGETLFPARVKHPKSPPRRTIESLQVEHDALVAQRDRLGATRDDRAAAMLSAKTAHREHARLDRDLAKFVRLTVRIDALANKIARNHDPRR